MFGDEIFVTPIVAEADSKVGTSTKQFWLPEGQWLEAETGTVMEGNQTYIRSFSQSEIPFYYKEGAIIPMYPDIKHLKTRPDSLIIQFIPGTSGSFSYYEDEGDNDAYKEGKYTITKITQETNSSQGKYTIYPREGSFTGMPSTRHYELRLLSKLPPKQVVVDGKAYPYSLEAKEEHWNYDSESLAIVINTPSINLNAKIETVVSYDDNQEACDELISGKMGQMNRMIQCHDSLKVKIGDKMPALFTKMVGTRDRIAAKPQTVLNELEYFEMHLEESLDLLIEADSSIKKESTEWKYFILSGRNTDPVNLEESDKNTVPGYNRDGSKLWIAGSAIPDGVAILTEDPTQIAGYFRYHGKLQTGEFRIMNTSTIEANTKFYVPTIEDANAVGTCSMQTTSDASIAGWSVTIPDDYYKIKVDVVANTLSGEIFMARQDLFIVGGATEIGWDSGLSLRLKKDIHNPNLFVFSGMLKEATSGDDRNMFKLLGQNNWDPVSFHPKAQGESLLESKYIFENLDGDHKWSIDQTKQGGYVIKVDLLEETISAEHTNLVALYINGVRWKDLDEVYTLDCSNSDTALDIEIVPLSDATVDIGTLIEYQATKPGLNTLDFVITSPNGEDKTSYQLKVLKPFAFEDLITQMWNNTLTVNNNAEKNGGYNFVSFEWYEDERKVGQNKQYYSAGKSSADLLNKDASYMVKLVDEKGYEYQTCPVKIAFETLSHFLVYPNPLRAGETLNIETGLDDQQLVNKVELKVYDISGNVIHNGRVTGNTASVKFGVPGTYLVQLTIDEDIRIARLLVK